jgi:hypothetical protein
MTARPRSRPHAIVRNGTDIMHVFGSACLAEEGMADLGCYVDRIPIVEDQFTVERVSLVGGRLVVAARGAA